LIPTDSDATRATPEFLESKIRASNRADERTSRFVLTGETA